MSFSLEIKQEISASFPEKECCKASLLSSIVLFAGKLGNNGLEVRAGNPSHARLVFRLFREIKGLDVLWEARETTKLGRKKYYLVVIPPSPNLEKHLTDWGFFLSEDADYYARLWRKPCCLGWFIKGAFLSAGSVNSPRRSYHAEFVLSSPQSVNLVLNALKKMKLNFKLGVRRGKFILYSRNAEHVSMLLSAVGAVQSLFKLEEIRAIRETKNTIQRAINAEFANMYRTAKAAARQIHSIKALRRKGKLASLPDDLRQVAALRLSMPQAGFAELGAEMKPPISKFIIRRKLEKLERMAHNLAKT